MKNKKENLFHWSCKIHPVFNNNDAQSSMKYLQLVHYVNYTQRNEMKLFDLA